MSKFDPIIAQIASSFETAKGEIYKFVNDGKKKSAASARKALLAMRKACNLGRKELQMMKSVLPVRRRIVSEATKEKMANARAAKKAPAKAATKTAAKPVSVAKA